MLLALVAILAGCATGTDPRDAYEPLDRGVYRFNDGLDTAIVQPAARAYRGLRDLFMTLYPQLGRA